MAYGSHWGITLLSLLKGKLIGQDEQKNRYYQERFFFKTPKRKPRRWVIYHEKMMEASSVSPEWFGWLHHYLEVPLDPSFKRPWQKTYQSNKTGTQLSYYPKAHSERTKESQSFSNTYEPWKPI
jgi:NADH:ubiquinone oxidoreductase subunit